MVAVALVLAYQDFKERKVSLWLLLIFGVLAMYSFYRSPLSLLELGFNVMYISVFMGLTFLAVRLLYQKEFKEMIGAGDLVFIMMLTPLFYFDQLVLWVALMTIFSLLGHTIVVRLHLTKEVGIPLVGYMGLFIAGVLVSEMF